MTRRRLNALGRYLRLLGSRMRPLSSPVVSKLNLKSPKVRRTPPPSIIAREVPRQRVVAQAPAAASQEVTTAA